MTKETMRKCSHCGHTGHNSRSCNNNSSFKLFGVQIDLNNHKNKGKKVDLELMRKSKSTGSLQTANKNNADDDGYLSDDMLPVRRTQDEQRKKGVPWTLDEHRAFLLGLKKLKKGDWKGISKNYVPTRTAAQVASHAQKYFIRHTSTAKKKRRSSLFDLPLQEPIQIASSSTPISLQVGNARASGLNNTSNIAGIQAATSELPPVSPLSPMATRAYGLRDFPYVPPHIVDYRPSNEQNVGAAKYKQAASFVPMVNYMYAAHGHGIFPVAGPSMSDLFAKPVPDGSSSRASVIKKDRLEAEVGAFAM